MLRFECTQDQYNALHGLAYRIADNQYMLERYDFSECTLERAENRKTISMLFDELDNLHVPFWVQNTVICWAENWRKYKTECLVSAFDKYKNIPEEFYISFDHVSNY